MLDNQHTMVKKFLEEYSLVESNITSFNDFVDNRMQVIVHEISAGLIEEDVKIELGKIRVEKPDIVEADGSKHALLPTEARLRNLTYSAPVYLEMSIKSGSESEHSEVEIGRIPIMVKSKYCHIYKMSKDQLIENNIDPADPGGYFIINGNERILTMLEDLAPNLPFVEEGDNNKLTLKIFSQRGAYKIPTTIHKNGEGIFEVNFSRFKKIPVVPLIKALGLTKDSDIAKHIGPESDSLIVNLYEYASVQSANDAFEFIAGKSEIQGTKKEIMDKIKSRLDSYFLPHIGITPEERIEKAVTLCKLIKQLLLVEDNRQVSDKDHYGNKRVKLSGDLFADLFRINLTVLIRDLQHNLQRLSKRKKFYSIRTLAKSTLFSHRVESAIATGNWIGERTGVTKNMDKTNYLSIFSDLQKVISLLPSEQENFLARTLHPTHYGRFCPIETPEGTPIGLRKNLALLSKVSTAVDLDKEKLKKVLKEIGMTGEIEKK